jgi:hypothetical protein
MQNIVAGSSSGLHDRIAAQWLLDAPLRPGGESL